MANPDNTPTPDTLQEALLMTPSSYNESSRTPYSTSLKPKSATTSTLSHTNERPAGKATATATNPDNSKPESAASSYSSPKTEMAPSGQNSSRSTNATRKPSCYP